MFETLTHRTIYESPWVNLHVDKMKTPDGTIIEAMHTIEIVKPAVGAIVVNEASEFLLIQAYRYATRSKSWEIPAGLIEPGETRELAAEREVREESGYATRNHQLQFTYHPMQGISNQEFSVVVCESDGQVDTYDTSEVGEVRWIDQETVKDMIRNQQITSGMTLTALCRHFSGI